MLPSSVSSMLNSIGATIAGKVIARAAPLLDVQPVLQATATLAPASITRPVAEAVAQ